MRRKVLLLCAVAGLSLASMAEADVLKLTSGGELKGSLDEVTFLAAGKEAKHARADVASLTLSETAKDCLVLANGQELRGELVSLKFRSVGGALPFARKTVALLHLAADPLAQAKKEYAAKRAAVKDDDAKGLLTLAEWCREKRLYSEAGQCARACLKADSDGEWSTQAKTLLGHQKKPDGPEPKPEPKLTREQIAQLNEALGKNNELYKTYLAKVDELKGNDLKEAQEKYGPEWKQLTDKIDKLKATIKKKKAARERAEKEWKDKYGKYARHYKNYKPNYKDGLSEDEDELEKTWALAKRTAKVMKSARSTISSRVGKRKGRVRLIHDKCERILKTGKLLTVTQMETAYESALKLD